MIKKFKDFFNSGKIKKYKNKIIIYKNSRNKDVILFIDDVSKIKKRINLVEIEEIMAVKLPSVFTYDFEDIKLTRETALIDKSIFISLNIYSIEKFYRTHHKLFLNIYKKSLMLEEAGYIGINEQILDFLNQIDEDDLAKIKEDVELENNMDKFNI